MMTRVSLVVCYSACLGICLAYLMNCIGVIPMLSDNFASRLRTDETSYVVVLMVALLVLLETGRRS